ncbi:MAG TPA: aminoglycoside phosphotransferase family protein [Actinopolymorphaceae bacterium]|nr:aminoglycoside phosphotransferase family protein [Actinopolymorphaceae bacterium]
MFSPDHDYGDHLGDARLWTPYVTEVLRRHGLRDGVSGQAPESGFVGTYPTFLCGPYVVKLFGHFGTWRTSYDTEVAMQRLLLDNPDIPAPRLVAAGQLYDGASESWPYLVTSRLRGRAWRDVRPPGCVGTRLAGRIGEIVRRLHELTPPDFVARAGDWPRDNRAGVVDRHRAWGSLPRSLVDQIPDFLLTPSPSRRLIHADLTEDHFFLSDDELVGIIDWGDALATDPYYELAALHLGAFEGDVSLLRAFVDGYGWPVDDEFAQRAMSMALMHQFDVFPGFRHVARRTDVADLHDLAAILWDVG